MESPWRQRADALLETRAKVAHEMEGFLVDLKGREMSAEEREKFDRYTERIDGLAREVDELIQRERNEHEAGLVREAQSAAFGRDVDEDAERVDMNQRIMRWARGEERMSVRDYDNKLVNGFQTNITAVMRERELLRQGATPDEVRAIVWDTGSSASVVPTILDRRLYEVLEANISALRMPVTRVVTASGEPMDFGKVVTHAVATQVAGQGTTFAGTDPTFGKLTLTPTKYAELIEVNNDVLTDNGVDLTTFLARDLGRAVGRRVNQAIAEAMIGGAVTGSGGTVATGGSLITPDYEDLINLQYSVNDAYRESGSAGWLAKDSTAGTLRKLRDGAGGTEGAPIWQPSTQTGISGQRQPDTLFGHPFWTDPNVAAQGSNAKILFFGDWNGFYARFVGDPIIERNDSVGFKEDDVYFRGKWRAAGGYQDLTAVNLLKMSVS